MLPQGLGDLTTLLLICHHTQRKIAERGAYAIFTAAIRRLRKGFESLQLTFFISLRGLELTFCKHSLGFNTFCNRESGLPLHQKQIYSYAVI